MTTLGKRLVISAILVTITLLTIFAAPEWVFFVIVELFILLALNEFFVLAEKKNFIINRYLGLFFGGLLPVSIFFSAESVTLAMACLGIFLFNFNRKLRDQALVSTSLTIFGIVYVSWFFSFLIKIRNLADGPAWVFYTLLIVKGGDAFAYFVGKKYGKVKLIEHISPNKSVEGAWGCLAGSILLSVISKTYLPDVPILHLLILGAVLGVISQFGDLAESLIKRDVGVKDSGSLPGLGGILDVLDSLILTVPFVYYYILAFIYRMRIGL